MAIVELRRFSKDIGYDVVSDFKFFQDREWSFHNRMLDQPWILFAVAGINSRAS